MKPLWKILLAPRFNLARYPETWTLSRLSSTAFTSAATGLLLVATSQLSWKNSLQNSPKVSSQSYLQALTEAMKHSCATTLASLNTRAPRTNGAKTTWACLGLRFPILRRRALLHLSFGTLSKKSRPSSFWMRTVILSPKTAAQTSEQTVPRLYRSGSR